MEARCRVSLALVLASETSDGAEASPRSMASSAASTQERVSSSSVNSFAARCCSAWNEPISWPNWVRVFR